MADDLLPLRAVEAYLDGVGIGAGLATAQRIGDGHSNLTYRIQRGSTRVILRRPPRPPLPPSAHDMLREARILQALAATRVRVPRVLSVCTDSSIVGAPFYLMEELDGVVLTGPPLDVAIDPRAVSNDLVDALCELHEVDPAACGLSDLGRPDGYLERQLARFLSIWSVVKTRELDAVPELGAWLAAHLPKHSDVTIVHGDYRLGNVMLKGSRISAILDWELATLGDPLADLGYLVASWSDAASPGTAIELSPITRLAGFADRDELVAHYAARTGRSVTALPFYEVLALWKAAVFCEGLYRRFQQGEQHDRWTANLEAGVPGLLAAAQRIADLPSSNATTAHS